MKYYFDNLYTVLISTITMYYLLIRSYLVVPICFDHRISSYRRRGFESAKEATDSTQDVTYSSLTTFFVFLNKTRSLESRSSNLRDTGQRTYPKNTLEKKAQKIRYAESSTYIIPEPRESCSHILRQSWRNREKQVSSTTRRPKPCCE